MKRETPSFSFHALGIGSVLQKRLMVPAFQREYSWIEEKVLQLFADLNQAITEDTDYFLGTIVTIPNSDDQNVLEVVDGQQRLTTTSLLIAAIRNFLISIGTDKSIVESINNSFLSAVNRRTGERKHLLTLNVDDNDYYASLMKSEKVEDFPEPQRDSHRLMLGAAIAAHKYIKRLTESYEENLWPDILNNWLDYLEYRASVILLVAPDEAHAFRMFETLNDRGLKTSQVDLVKSYLFGEAPYGSESTVIAGPLSAH